MSDIYHWAKKNEVKLACENVTDDYSVFCYKSALRRRTTWHRLLKTFKEW